MRATHPSEVNGDWGWAPARPVDEADGLYRYVPVPPVYCDEDGHTVLS